MIFIKESFVLSDLVTFVHTTYCVYTIYSVCMCELLLILSLARAQLFPSCVFNGITCESSSSVSASADPRPSVSCGGPSLGVGVSTDDIIILTLLLGSMEMPGVHVS